MSSVVGIKKGISRVVAAVSAGDPIDLALRATLLVFILGPNLHGLEWYYKMLFQVVCVVGLIARPVGQSAVFWCGISVMMVYKTVDHWWMQDNHVFLLTWWCIAIAVGLVVRDRGVVVPLNARWLIGLSFLLATLWKGFISPDYMSGSYFHYTFLTDSRFSQLGVLLGGMTEADYQHNYEQVRRLSNYVIAVDSVQLRGTDALRWVTFVVTWWTVLIEGALAVVFLAPKSWALSRYRHATLILFAWTTYLAAPVKTFGWTLTSMGLAQCEADARKTRVCYMVTYPLLLIYEQAPIWESINRLVAGWS